MSKKIPAGAVTRIECVFDKKAPCPKWAFNAYKVEHPKFAKEKIFHYDLYLPDDYYKNPDKRYPCIFITSPGGNAKLGNLADWVKKNRWIAVMLVESKNDSPEWLSNFIAAHDDAVKRCRILEGMKYATGFSGGARCAGTQVGVRKGFAGLILQGAGFNYDNSGSYIYDAVKSNKGISICVIMGTDDSNKKELKRLMDDLPRQNHVEYIRFSGGHSWGPEEKMNEAMNWMMRQLCLTATRRKVLRYIYDYDLEHLDGFSNKLEKYETLVQLVEIAVKHKLVKTPEQKKQFLDIKSQLLLLKKDKDIVRELKAKKVFNAVLLKETKMRKKIAKGRLKKKQHVRELSRLIRAYGNISKIGSDTFYAKKAKSKIAELETEKDSVNP